VTTALGAVALSVALVTLTQTGLPDQRDTLLALLFVGLQITAVARPLPLARRQFLSLYTAVVFAAVLLFEPALAMLIAALGTLVAERLRHQPKPQVLFNTIHVALQAGSAGLVVASASGAEDILRFQQPSAFAVVLGAALGMYAIDVLAVSLIVAAQEQLAFARVAQRTLADSGLEDMAQFALGLLTALLVEEHAWALPLVVLLAVFVYRTSAQAAAVREQERLLRVATERTAQARKEFLLTASHELKTPITSIKAAAQLLARGVSESRPTADPQKLATWSRIISTQVERLETLVRDLLDAARIEQGRLELRRKPVDVVEIARQVLERFEDLAERDPPHTLVLDAPQPVVGVWDPVQVDHVLTNLISNALKYSPAGGEVRVRIAPRDGWVSLRVSDQGVGIAAEEQAHLLEPFARGSNAGPGIAGTGLGLYITAAIVQRHGGDLRIDSSEGVGTTIVVRLPLTPRDAVQPPRARDDEPHPARTAAIVDHPNGQQDTVH
jgi:signal transduction histidine kinase